MQSTRHYPRFREHRLRIFHDGSQKRRESFWSIRRARARVFCRRCTSREKRGALLSNLINILTRDCSSTLFRTMTMSSKFLGISTFARIYCIRLEDEEAESGSANGALWTCSASRFRISRLWHKYTRFRQAIKWRKKRISARKYKRNKNKFIGVSA